MNFEAIPSLVNGLVALALAGFVWSRAPLQVANWAFAWGMIALAGMEFAHTRLLALDWGRGLVWAQLALGAEAVMMPGWAVFSVTFARADARGELRRWRWLVGGIGGIALATLGVTVLRPLILLSASEDERIVPLTAEGKALAIFALLVTVFVLFQLESTLRRSRGVTRWQIKYFLLGMIGLFAFHILVLSNMLLTNALLLEYLPIQSTAGLLASVLIAFCLIRHRLLQVDVFVSRQMVYQSFAVAAVGVYLLMMGAAGWVMQRLDITVSLFFTSLAIFVTAIALLIGFLSESVRRRVKQYIARHFYRHKYDYRHEWMEVTRKLTSVVSPDAIPPRLLAIMGEAMGVRKAALYVSDDAGEYRLAEWMGDHPTDAPRIAKQDLLVSRLASERRPLAITTLPQNDPLAGAVAPFQAQGFAFLVALKAKDGVLGLLAVGPPAALPVTQDDEDLLATMAAQAAMALLNARLAEQLAQAREFEALSRVSTFMLHDLKNCASMLSLVTQNAETMAAEPSFQRDAFRTVAESARKMQDLIGRLSHLPKGLELRLARVDLNGLVREAVGRVRPAIQESVRLSTELDALPSILADEDHVRTVLDNLLINAVEAVHDKGELRVRTTVRNGCVTLEVSDNGPGIPEAILRAGLFIPFRTTKPRGLGIGLYQVNAIVQAHRGHIYVDSREGRGTSIRIELPTPGADSSRSHNP